MSLNLKHITNYYLDIILIIVLLGISLGYFTQFNLISFDEEVFLWCGQNILNHEIPYKDFFEIKPPVIFFINALGISLFGLKHYAFKWLGYILVGLATTLLFWSMRTLKMRKIYAFSIGLSLIYLLFNPAHHEGTINDSETYGLLFTIIAFACIHWRTRTNAARNLMKFGGGVALALAILSKEPFVLIVLPMVVINYAFESPTAGAAKKAHLVSILLGAGSVCLLLVGYLWAHAALAAYLAEIKKTLIYSQTYASSYGIWQSKSWFATIKYVSAKLYHGYFEQMRFWALIPFYVAFGYTWRWSWFTLLNISGLLAGMYSVTIGYCFFVHYYTIGIFPFIAIAVYGAVAITTIRRQAFLILNFLAVLLAGWLCCQMLVTAWRQASAADFKMIHNDFMMPSALQTAIDQYTKPDDYILLLSSHAYYYALLNRRHAFKFAIPLDGMIPIYDGVTNADKMRLLTLDVVAKLPKVIYIENSWLFAKQQQHLSQIVVPLIQQYHYQQINAGVFVLPANLASSPSLFAPTTLRW